MLRARRSRADSSIAKKLLDSLDKDDTAILSDGIDAGIRIIIGSDIDNVVHYSHDQGTFFFGVRIIVCTLTEEYFMADTAYS